MLNALQSLPLIRATVVFLLAAVAVLAVGSETVVSDEGWRRTAHGWENISNWQPHIPQYSPPLAATVHPLVVAGLELLIVAGIGVFFQKNV